MTFRERMSDRWHRYLKWRKAEGMRMPVKPEVPKKVDASDQDIILERYSNRSGGTGYP